MNKELASEELPNNDKKIISYNQGSQKVKNFFLEEAADTNKAPTPYLIEDEFTKTKKNYNYSNLFILLASCTFIITSSFLIVYFYEKIQEREKINIKIEEFADINIEEVLFQANSFKNELLEKRRELIGLEEQKKNELQEVFFSYDNKVKELVGDDSLSSSVKRVRNQTFFNERKQQEEVVLVRYDGRINNLQSEIDELTKKVSLLDQQAIEQAIKTDDLAGYQEKLLNTRIEIIEKENEESSN